MLLNQSGVWLPATANRQTLEAEVGEKGKGSLVKFSLVWENAGPPISRFIRQNPAYLVMLGWDSANDIPSLLTSFLLGSTTRRHYRESIRLEGKE